MKNSTYLFLATLFLLSCTKDNSNINDDVSIFGYDSTEVARKELGIYAKLFEVTNASAQLQTTRYNTTEVFGTIFGRFQESSSSSRTDGGIFLIDDLRLVHSDTFQQYIPVEGKLNPQESYDRISQYFGHEVSFSVENDGTKVEDSYYVPEEIRVEVEGLMRNSATNAYSIKSRETETTWNADNRNKNGIVVHLVFNGQSLASGGSTDLDSSFERAIKFADNGEGKIPKEFFEGIPEDGVFTIYFIRGAVEILEDKSTNKTYKFYSLTKDKQNFVLKK